MPRTLIKSKLHSNKPKIKQQVKNTKSCLPSNLQTINQKLLSGKDFIVNL